MQTALKEFCKGRVSGDQLIYRSSSLLTGVGRLLVNSKPEIPMAASTFEQTRCRVFRSGFFERPTRSHLLTWQLGRSLAHGPMVSAEEI